MREGKNKCPTPMDSASGRKSSLEKCDKALDIREDLGKIL